MGRWIFFGEIYLRNPDRALEERQGFNHRAIALIIGAKFQHGEQPRHYPPRVIAIRGTHPQIDSMVIRSFWFFIRNGLALLSAHDRVDPLENRLIGVIKCRWSSPERMKECAVLTEWDLVRYTSNKNFCSIFSFRRTGRRKALVSWSQQKRSSTQSYWSWNFLAAPFSRVQWDISFTRCSFG